MATSQTILSKLCSICHIEAPKYCCPRCATRTCSLNCVKAHKTRAPCSGIRDPTVFKRKRDLETAAGIDHDYNFLSCVERRVERKEELAEELLKKGSEVAQPDTRDCPRPRKKQAGGWRVGTHRELVWERKVKEQGINLIRAPKGLQRREENRSRWGRNRRKLVWEVEWVVWNEEDDTGHKIMEEVCEDADLCEAWRVAQKRIKLGKKEAEGKQDGVQHEVKKLRVEEVESDQEKQLPRLPTNARVEVAPAQAESTGAYSPGVDGLTSDTDDESDDNSTLTLSTASNASDSSDEPSSDTDSDGESDSESDSFESDNEDVGSHSTPENVLATARSTPKHTDPNTSAAFNTTSTPKHPSRIGDGGKSPESSFFLIQPGTSGPERVLCPISRKTSLVNCLPGQTIYEFPSIQVVIQARGGRSEGDESGNTQQEQIRRETGGRSQGLPPGCILIDEYRRKEKAQTQEWKRTLQELQSSHNDLIVELDENTSGRGRGSFRGNQRTRMRGRGQRGARGRGYRGRDNRYGTSDFKKEGEERKLPNTADIATMINTDMGLC